MRGTQRALRDRVDRWSRGAVLVAATSVLAACGAGPGPAGSPSRSPAALPPIPVGTFAVTETAGVPYDAADGAPLLLDAFVPVARRSSVPPTVPAVVLVHGGDFVVNTRASLDPLARQVASAGFAAFSIDYTLATPTQPSWPVAVRQVLAAVAWVRRNATAYHVDRHAVVVLGASAGATLAVDAGLLGSSGHGDAVQATAGWSGLYRLTAADPAPVISVEHGVQEYVGCADTSPSCRAASAAASPVDNVSARAAPTLLATSDDYRPGCEIVDPAQSRLMYAALLRAHVPSVLDVNDACAHAQSYADIALRPTLAWFRSVLSPTPLSWG